MSTVARVVVEIALDREFDYAIPSELEGVIVVGSMVRVPFGRSETRGFVIETLDQSERDDLKMIKGAVGHKPLIQEQVMKLARWMAEYYCAPIEQAVRTVLPGAVRRKGAKFKQQFRVSLTDAMAKEGLEAPQLKRAPKQATVVKLLLEQGPMVLQDLVRASGSSAAVVRALADKGCVTMASESVGREPRQGKKILETQPHELMEHQREALAAIMDSIEKKDPLVSLLFGVTASGKTEVYLQAIQYVLDQDQGAIMLVPEISLTPQTVERFRGRFGDRVAILHSHLSDGERHDEWHRIHEGQARIAVGARSAIFSPIHRLGLIIVDEEHENSYKQEEAPRYHARDVAVMRGHMEQCAVVLGSATPSMESLYNVMRKKYRMVKLPHRVDHQKMPSVRVVDMRSEMEREGRLQVLSRDLLDAIQMRLNRAEQVILFLNRRGYSTSLICPCCGYVAECDQCSVSLTYHRQAERLCCHLCGAQRGVPTRCPNPDCRDPSFRFAGMGTQKVESVIRKVFPHARIARMDADTMTRKDAYDHILGDVRSGKIDILIGTQMIAKGLHFPNVTLVGVISADSSLHLPDFRAGERTFQLLTQVAGRAGRGDVVGEVIVQTFTPFHTAIQAARNLDYERFFDQELEFRRELFYPPFAHLICMTLRGPVDAMVAKVGKEFVRLLAPRLPEGVTLAGPTPAPLARIKGLYRYQIMLRGRSVRRITKPLRDVIASYKWPRTVQAVVDVDALSLL